MRGELGETVALPSRADLLECQLPHWLTYNCIVVKRCPLLHLENFVSKLPHKPIRVQKKVSINLVECALKYALDLYFLLRLSPVMFHDLSRSNTCDGVWGKN